MKALVLKENGIFELNPNHPEPMQAAGEILVKVTAAGVCSSDIPRSFKSQSYFYPAILGHEIVGETESGEVAVYPLIACRACDACSKEVFNLCRTYDYIGSRRHGGFAEQVVAPSANIISLPKGLEPSLSVLTEPVAVLIHALSKARLLKESRVLIVGDGAMALLLVKLLSWRGVKDITILGKYEHKLVLAQEFGAKAIFSDSSEILKYNNSFDIAFELAGSIQAYESAIALLKFQGQWILVSNIKQDFALSKKDFSTILRKELVITGCWNSLPHEWPTAGEFLRLHPEAKKVISHIFPIHEGPKAMQAIFEKKLDNYIKAAFIF